MNNGCSSGGASGGSRAGAEDRARPGSDLPPTAATLSPRLSPRWTGAQFLFFLRLAFITFGLAPTAIALISMLVVLSTSPEQGITLVSICDVVVLCSILILSGRMLVTIANKEKIDAGIVSPANGLIAVEIGVLSQIQIRSRDFGRLDREFLDLSKRLALAIKRMLDVTLALAALALLLPLFIVLCLIIKSDGGPAFFFHTRVGFQGRLFPCIKFRTMVENSRDVLNHFLATNPAAAAAWRENQRLRNDPRFTRIGRFLRATSLDELPQLINVLRNEMSLVGPRPIVVDEIKRYGDYIHFYTAMPPGITGLWQISKRHNTSYERRVKLDVYYVQTWSLWRDISILFMTIPAVILREGAN